MGDTPVVGASEPFDAFYRREYRSVLGLAIALTGSRTTGEELAQDAFEALLRRWDKDPPRNPAAWVRRVATNKSVSRFRRALAEARAMLRSRPTDESHEVVDQTAAVDVWREVRRLPARQAQAVALTYLEGMTRGEVAEVLDCSLETVKTHLDRARHTLASRLGEEF